MANNTNNNSYTIGSGYQYAATLRDMLKCGIGDSIFIRSIDIKDAVLSRNPTKTRYGIDSDTLVSKDYGVFPIGDMGGTPKIGERTVINEHQVSDIHFLDEEGGLVGFTDNQDSIEPEDRIFIPGKFRNEVLNNDTYQEGASFIPVEKIDYYSTNEPEEVREKNTENYAKDSIDTVIGVPTGLIYNARVRGKSSYDLENLAGPNKGSGDRRTLDYIHYDEGAVGNRLNSFDLLSDLDDYEFNTPRNFGPQTLVTRTNDMFRQRKIGSLASRFCTGSDFLATEWPTAKTEYGMSRGRNLLKKSPDTQNGYTNPYCRVWTTHYQYSKVKNLIRPFTNDGSFIDYKTLHGSYQGFRSHDGADALDKYSVLDKNGFVKIAPKKEDFLGDLDPQKQQQLQKYMFSIENLAWENSDLENYDIIRSNDTRTKERNKLKGHYGPNGGRIMWFPPYNLSFSENVSVDWNSNDFIGRGERIYTYKNTDRGGTLEFTVLVDHPSVVDMFVDQHADDDESKSYENEQTLLRFFAGCDNDIVDGKKCFTEIKKEDAEYEEEVIPFDDDCTFKVCFPVFYPNNLSFADLLKGENVGEKIKKGFEYLYKTYEDGTGYVLGDESGNAINLGGFTDVSFAYQDDRPCRPKIKTFKEGIGNTADTRTEPYMMDDKYKNQRLYETFTDKDTKKKVEHFQGYYDNTSYGLNSKLFKEYVTGLKSETDLENKTDGTDAAKIGIVSAHKKAVEYVMPDVNLDYYYITLEDIMSGGEECEFSKEKMFNIIKTDIQTREEAKSEDGEIHDINYYFKEWIAANADKVNACETKIYNDCNTEISKPENSIDSGICKYVVYLNDSSIEGVKSFEYKRIDGEKQSNEDTDKICKEIENYIENKIIECRADNIKNRNLYAYEKLGGDKLYKYANDTKKTHYRQEWLENGNEELIIDTMRECETIINNHFNVVKKSDAYKSIEQLIDRYVKYEYTYSIDTSLPNIELAFNCYLTTEIKGEIKDDDFNKLLDFIEQITREAKNTSDEKLSGYRLKMEKYAHDKVVMDDIESGTNLSLQKGDEKSELMDYPELWKVIGVQQYGSASSHGYVSENNILGSNRASAISELLIACNIFSREDLGEAKTAIKPVTESTKEETPRGHVTLPSAKAGRNAFVVVTFQLDKDAVNKKIANIDNNKVSDNLVQGSGSNAIASSGTSSGNPITQTILKKKYKRTLKKEASTKMEVSCDVKYNYIDEYQFFKRLKEEDHLIYKELTKKLSYFNPAFHSVTPEGFNARLTFLHQCTRQGPTYPFSSNDYTGEIGDNEKNKFIGPGNLAFGKPPYCVLRIGDFYNTKIIIDSLSITYDTDGIKWDLNQEGIGVQPMMAKISLGIKFLGGSDLSGPISRLQNAVSSNFYANTSVYDPNAVTVERVNKDKANAYNEGLARLERKKNKARKEGK